jgi:diguanylate cyclase (GGDEF)-like protein
MNITTSNTGVRGNFAGETGALSNLLVALLERQGLSVRELPTRKSDWDWLLRSFDRAFADMAALEVQANRASAMAEEELSVLQASLKANSDQINSALKDTKLSQQTLDVAGIGWFVFDLQSSNIAVNAGLAGMLGLEKTGIEMPLAVLRHSLSEQDQPVLLNAIARASASSEQVEFEFRPQSNRFEERWFTCRLKSFKEAGSESRKMLGVVLDVTRRRHAEQRAINLASFDQLTRVCNRQHFFTFCRDKMAAPGSAEEPFALLFLSLDGFKELNDSMGHKAGDQLLQLIALRITSCMPDPTCVARYGTDEFLIMVKNACDVRHIQSLADSLLNQLSKPLTLEASDVSISAGIGVTFFPSHGVTLDRLLQNADTAMHKAKAAGRNGWMVFDESINAEISARFAMIDRLRNAIDSSHLDLAFQPLVDGQTGRILSVEALARWYDAELGPISPAIFIPLAESCGLIEAIGQFVLRQALKTMKGWDSEGTQEVILSVNFSAIQFSNPNFVEMIRDVLAEHGLPANRLQVEITESMMLSDIESCNTKLQALRRLGVTVAIDDFGTGYSSLAYLESLPITCIKIDRSFVAKIVDVDQRLPMIEAVIAIAKSLRMDVLAEGVETAVQRQTLLNLGCKMMQGYYFHRPMTASNTAQVLLGRTVESPARSSDALPTPDAKLFHQNMNELQQQWNQKVSW